MKASTYRQLVAEGKTPAQILRAATSPEAELDAPIPPATKRRRADGSATERLMHDALLAAGYVELRDFIRQHSWALDEGRGYRADFAFPKEHLLVEVEGGAHAIKRQHLEDCQRASLAAAVGYRIVRVHRSMIESGEALALLRRALA